MFSSVCSDLWTENERRSFFLLKRKLFERKEKIPAEADKNEH